MTTAELRKLGSRTVMFTDWRRSIRAVSPLRFSNCLAFIDATRYRVLDARMLIVRSMLARITSQRWRSIDAAPTTSSIQEIRGRQWLFTTSAA